MSHLIWVYTDCSLVFEFSMQYYLVQNNFQDCTDVNFVVCYFGGFKVGL